MSAIDTHHRNIGTTEAMHPFKQCTISAIADHHRVGWLLTNLSVIDKFGRNYTQSVLLDIFGKCLVYGVFEAVTLYGSEDFVNILGAERNAFA